MCLSVCEIVSECVQIVLEKYVEEEDADILTYLALWSAPAAGRTCVA